MNAVKTTRGWVEKDASSELTRALNLLRVLGVGDALCTRRYCGLVASVSIRGVVTVVDEKTGLTVARSLPGGSPLNDPVFIAEETARREELEAERRRKLERFV